VLLVLLLVLVLLLLQAVLVDQLSVITYECR
jgi:hypothetical protein